MIRVGSRDLEGVFIRERRPKLAAYRLRQIWGGGVEG